MGASGVGRSSRPAPPGRSRVLERKGGSCDEAGTGIVSDTSVRSAKTILTRKRERRRSDRPLKLSLVEVETMDARAVRRKKASFSVLARLHASTVQYILALHSEGWHRAMSARAALRRSRQACRRCQSTLAIANSKVNANNAYIHIPNKAAKPRSQTKDDGLLAGWPTSIKANLCTADGLPTSCASKMLEDYVSPFEATAVGLLRSQGADIVGKTNCDEFGMGSANVHSAFGAVLNPNDARSVAGGSSGGAAASVAEGSARIALGSDTGGSVRLPAAYCGVYGLKASYGLISRWGLVSYADSLDTVGLLARSVDDIDLAFSIVNTFDEQDPTAIDDDVRQGAVAALNESAALTSNGDTRPLEGLRVGIPHEYFPKELAHRTLGPLRETLRSMQRAGATLVPVSLPRTEVALSAYYVIASAEASSNLARYDGIRYGEGRLMTAPMPLLMLTS